MPSCVGSALATRANWRVVTPRLQANGPPAGVALLKLLVEVVLLVRDDEAVQVFPQFFVPVFIVKNAESFKRHGQCQQECIAVNRVRHRSSGTW